jgi:hypothetical protein
MDRGSEVRALASAYVLRPLSSTALGFWEWILAEGQNYIIDYGGILVDIRTDLHTCFLGVFIAKRVSGSGEHMTGDRQGETNYERNAG